MIEYNGNRLLRMNYGSDGMTVDACASNLPAEKLKYYEYRTGSTYTELSNMKGTFYFQPSITAPGRAKIPVGGVNSWVDKPVVPLFSAHYTPYRSYRPSVGKDSNGNVTTAICSYSGGEMIPYLKRDDILNQPSRDLSFAGSNVDEIVYAGDWSRIDVTDTAYHGKDCRLRGSAWFMALVHGTVTMPTVKWKAKSSNQGDEYDCTQSTSVTEMLRSGSDAWMLIKSSAFALVQDSFADDYHRRPQYIDQPRLSVNLSNGSIVTVTSYGFDVWVYDFA